jgi:hypothetical protein
MRVVINQDEVDTFLENLRLQMQQGSTTFFIKFSFGKADAEKMLANGVNDREMVLVFGGGITA